MIKLCGVRREEDISYMNEFLPDYIGMILSPGFRRSVQLSDAARLLEKLDGRIKKVGVFVDAPVDYIRQAVNIMGLDVIQLHGIEDKNYISAVSCTGAKIWKAVRVRCGEDIIAADKLGCEFLLLDSFTEGAAGGTGKVADWDIIKSTKINTPFFLAGGIAANNLEAALTVSENIDISGGTETDGVKDRNKIDEIMNIYERNFCR